MYLVNCEKMSGKEIGKLVTELVNYPVGLDDYDIELDDDCFWIDKEGKAVYDIKEFSIVGEHDYYVMLDIEKVLDKYNTKYIYC